MRVRADGERDDGDFSFPHALTQPRSRTRSFVEPVVFVNDDLRPTVEASSAVYFGCNPNDADVLYTVR